MRMDHEQKNDKIGRARGLGRKTTGNRNGDSNDSPEIPDRRVTSDTPVLPSGWERRGRKKKSRERLITINHR